MRTSHTTRSKSLRFSPKPGLRKFGEEEENKIAGIPRGSIEMPSRGIGCQLIDAPWVVYSSEPGNQSAEDRRIHFGSTNPSTY